MSDSFHFELVSPESLLKDTAVQSVTVPGAEGDFAVLPNHAPLMSTIRPGVVEVLEVDASTPERLFLKGGLAQVTPTGLTILAEETLPLDTVDAAALAQDLADAREDLEDAKDDVERSRVAKKIAWMEALTLN